MNIDSKVIELVNSCEKSCLEEFKKIVSFIIIGGYSEKGTKLPYVYRYVYSSKQCLRKDYKEKVLSNPLKDDDYIKLLDFRSDFSFRYFDEKKNNHRRKGNRIIRSSLYLAVSQMLTRKLDNQITKF